MTYVKQIHRLTGFFRDLFRHESGGTITTIALSASFLVAFLGLAIDTTRGYMLKQRLTYAMDTAALAAAKTAATEDVQATGQLYFDANFPSGYMGVSNVSVSFTPTNNDTEVTVTASADMPTALMNVVGIKDFNLSLETIAQRQAKGLELAIALDTTGSMCNSGCYIDDLQDATNGLLDVLYGSNDEVDNLFVALLPFDVRVNLAAYPSLVNFTPSLPTNVCANPRSGHYVDDEPPASAPFNNTSPTWWPTWTPVYGCAAQSAMGLTASKSTLQTKIAALSANGGTRIDIAAAWTFRALSPDWRGLWGDPDLPLDYTEELMDKAAIIMTDGKNSPLDGTSKNTANNRLAEACDNMTDEGIIVYTVQFKDNDTTTKNLLTNCATSAAHYYHADTDELSAVFNEIAAKLSNLRIIQ